VGPAGRGQAHVFASDILVWEIDIVFSVITDFYVHIYRPHEGAKGIPS
jgi:hypothetical protein